MGRVEGAVWEGIVGEVGVEGFQSQRGGGGVGEGDARGNELWQ